MNLHLRVVGSTVRPVLDLLALDLLALDLFDRQHHRFAANIWTLQWALQRALQADLARIGPCKDVSHAASAQRRPLNW
jgi:hypothetical protein